MKLKNLLIFIYVSLLFVPERLFAIEDIQLAQEELCNLDYSLGGKNATGNQCLDPTTGIWNALDNIIGRLPFYLTAIAFFAFLYSGGLYIFALGDANKQETAKKNMLWTAIGMIVMVSIGIIIKLAKFLGTNTVELTNTDVPGLTR